MRLPVYYKSIQPRGTTSEQIGRYKTSDIASPEPQLGPTQNVWLVSPKVLYPAISAGRACGRLMGGQIVTVEASRCEQIIGLVSRLFHPARNGALVMLLCGVCLVMARSLSKGLRNTKCVWACITTRPILNTKPCYNARCGWLCTSDALQLAACSMR